MAKEVKTTTEVSMTKLEKAEAYVKGHQKAIVITLCSILAAVAICLIYYFFILMPKKKAASDKLAVAIELFDKGDFENALNGKDGFAQLISNDKHVESIVYLYAATSALNLGDATAALSYIDEFKTEDDFLIARSEGLKGDAYAAQQDYANAVVCYETAADMVKDFCDIEYLFKAAQAHELLGQNDKALDIYKLIKEQYPVEVVSNQNPSTMQYSQSMATFAHIAQNIDKYISRLEVK